MSASPFQARQAAASCGRLRNNPRSPVQRYDTLAEFTIGDVRGPGRNFLPDWSG